MIYLYTYKLYNDYFIQSNNNNNSLRGPHKKRNRISFFFSDIGTCTCIISSRVRALTHYHTSTRYRESNGQKNNNVKK